MQFQIPTEEFLKALSRVQGIVERRSTNPIISNVLLEAKKGKLRVTATDTQVSLKSSFDVDTKSGGTTTVSARTLFEIVKNMPVDVLELTLDGDVLELSGGSDSFKLRTLPSDEYPPVPAFEGDPLLSVPAADLCTLIERCNFSISADETRTGLNGAHLEIFNEDGAAFLRMVATDGHRLSLAQVALEGSPELPPLLISRKGLSELRRILEGEEGNVEISREGSQLLLRWGSTVFTARLLEGQFPDYRQVIPSSWQRRVVVDSAAFAAAIKRVSVLSPEKSNSVRFELGGEGLVLESRHSELGSARIPLEAETEGKELVLGFNGRYFRDVLGVLSGGTINIEMGDSLSPTLIKPEEDESMLFVIMPMRIE